MWNSVIAGKPGKGFGGLLYGFIVFARAIEVGEVAVQVIDGSGIQFLRTPAHGNGFLEPTLNHDGRGVLVISFSEVVIQIDSALRFFSSPRKIPIQLAVN